MFEIEGVDMQNLFCASRLLTTICFDPFDSLLALLQACLIQKNQIKYNQHFKIKMFAMNYFFTKKCLII